MTFASWAAVVVFVIDEFLTQWTRQQFLFGQTVTCPFDASVSSDMTSSRFTASAVRLDFIFTTRTTDWTTINDVLYETC